MSENYTRAEIDKKLQQCLGTEISASCLLCRIHLTYFQKSHVEWWFRLLDDCLWMTEERMLTCWKTALTSIKDIYKEDVRVNNELLVLQCILYIEFGCDFPIIESVFHCIPIPTLMDINIHLLEHDTTIFNTLQFLDTLMKCKGRKPFPGINFL